jgi:hypothetical protein
MEFHNFKKSPYKYLKEDRDNLKMRILEDDRKWDVKTKTEYLKGTGWLSKSQINSLKKDGYEIHNSQLRKIIK